MANYVLEILDGDRAGDVLPVSDRALRIGRKPGNDLVIADEKTSGVHAEVVVEGDRHVLRDLGSTNGTFLDDKRVTEIVLTPGDIVTVGRVRLKFRDAAAPAASADGDLAVRRLDAGRLQRRGGSTAVLGVVLVAVLGGAGWFWWQSQPNAADNGAAPAKQAPLVVTGNRLAAPVAGCEDESGWNLRAGGGGFQPAGTTHSGRGAFEALRGQADDAADFALATLQEALPVFGGRTMTIAAHLTTSGGGLAGLRAVCFANGDASPFRFRTGTPIVAHDGWQRVEVVVAVPAGCDRLQLEVVAVLPAADAAAAVDDVAVVEGGAATAVEQKLTESSQTLQATGAALAVRSVDADNPATLLDVLPLTTPPAFAGLQRAGLVALSDLGAKVSATAGERSFRIQVEGTADVQLVFPADAAGGLMVDAGGAGFVAAAAETQFTAAALLLGDRATRALLRFDAATACAGQVGGGRFRLGVQAAAFELVLGFRGERQQAAELVRQAQQLVAGREPGRALERLRELVRTVPMDTEVLAQAQALRTQVLAAQSAELQQLQVDLDEAAFFDTRGGFARVVRGLDDVVARYGEANLEDAAAVAALRERAVARLRTIDAAAVAAEAQRLRDLSQAFADQNQPGLAKVVMTYVEQHLAPK
ncbi:MAG: FHA domain-containing protein [Planctomycetes bacterium]|nr:FHA domain-containing protein [Planctomycetota bacterium]